MALVVLIEEPEKFDEFTEADMRRWWRHRCKRHWRDGELYFEIAEPRIYLWESVRRLASFGVAARVARRVV